MNDHVEIDLSSRQALGMELSSGDMAVKCVDLIKTYDNGSGKLTVLDRVSFSMYSGAAVVIMGKSGSGKSTFLHLVGGLDKPDSGEIIVGENRVHTLRRDKLAQYRKDTIGFIFQMHYLLEDFTALENLVVTAMVQGMKKKDARKTSIQLLESVGLADKAGNYPGQMSGGERQRVAIARALLNDPTLILADEPTGNLDEENSRVIEELLFNLVRERGKSLILVTHDAYIQKYADTCLFLKKGVFEVVHAQK